MVNKNQMLERPDNVGQKQTEKNMELEKLAEKCYIIEQ